MFLGELSFQRCQASMLWRSFWWPHPRNDDDGLYPSLRSLPGCRLSTVRPSGSLRTTVESFRNRLPNLTAASRDHLCRPHFRSPPLITDPSGVLIRHASSDAECQARGPCCELRCYKSRPTSSSAQKIFRIWYLSARALRTSVRIRPRLRFC